jgi:hypothetical protein
MGGESNNENEDIMMMELSSSPPNCNRTDSISNDSGLGSSDEDDPGCFPYLRKLMFDGNPIANWEEVAKLGRWRGFQICIDGQLVTFLQV